jgi:hypothetical protein
MQFYSLKHRKTVEVPDSDISPRIVERTLGDGRKQERFLLEANTVVDGDQVKLTKFVGREAFDAYSRAT